MSMGGLPAILNLDFIVLTKSATFEPGKLPTKSTPVYWLITYSFESDDYIGF